MAHGDARKRCMDLHAQHLGFLELESFIADAKLDPLVPQQIQQAQQRNGGKPPCWLPESCKQQVSQRGSLWSGQWS